MKAFKKIWVLLLLFISLYGTPGCDTTSHGYASVQYVNPPWAPPYYPGIRYYYFPDIETYYDLSSRDFACLQNGQWLFSDYLPANYAWFDLYSGFVIALHFNVFQPWMHHQYYVSHYPRYYYHNVYGYKEFPDIRGFNENERKPIHRQPGDVNRAYAPAGNDNIEKRQQISRPPQAPNYYGKDIGQPVKVRPNMKESNQPKSKIERPPSKRNN